MAPSAQRKAQEELSSVVGLSRLPTLDDIASLPYVQAIILEVMRWVPVLPLGLPHRSLEDDEYDGYFIPAGTIIYGVCPFVPSMHFGALTESYRTPGMSLTHHLSTRPEQSQGNAARRQGVHRRPKQFQSRSLSAGWSIESGRS